MRRAVIAALLATLLARQEVRGGKGRAITPNRKELSSIDTRSITSLAIYHEEPPSPYFISMQIIMSLASPPTDPLIYALI